MCIQLYNTLTAVIEIAVRQVGIERDVLVRREEQHHVALLVLYRNNVEQAIKRGTCGTMTPIYIPQSVPLIAIQLTLSQKQKQQQ